MPFRLRCPMLRRAPCRRVLWLLIAVLLAATAHAAGHASTDHPAVSACDRATPPVQSFVVARGDSLWRLMHEAGFSKQQWQAVVSLDGPVQALRQLKPRASASHAGRLRGPAPVPGARTRWSGSPGHRPQRRWLDCCDSASGARGRARAGGRTNPAFAIGRVGLRRRRGRNRGAYGRRLFAAGGSLPRVAPRRSLRADLRAASCRWSPARRWPAVRRPAERRRQHPARVSPRGCRRTGALLRCRRIDAAPDDRTRAPAISACEFAIRRTPPSSDHRPYPAASRRGFRGTDRHPRARGSRWGRTLSRSCGWLWPLHRDRPPGPLPEPVRTLVGLCARAARR